MAQKKKDKKAEGTITCIWCYSLLTPQETATHPCTQSDFLDSDKVKYAKMIHPSNQKEWKFFDDSIPPWSYRDDEED